MTLPFKVTWGYRKNVASQGQPPILEYRTAERIVHAPTYEQAQKIVQNRWKAVNPEIKCLWSPQEIEMIKKKRKK
tara:strand:- start:311 stop:535 length:225 start_codon:yes stop_codon:yes gene_type:complete